MGRLIAAILVCCSLSSCAAVATVAAIPGAVMQGYNYFIKGQETGVPRDMRTSLALVQKGLRRVDMHVDVLEPLSDGYAVSFGGHTLDGDIQLVRTTEHLTTIKVSVRKGVLHQKSVEKAIITAIQNKEPTISSKARFQFEGYIPLLQNSIKGAEKIAWYRHGAYAEMKPAKPHGWLELTLPSGNKAYLRGHMAHSEAAMNTKKLHQAIEE